MDLAGGVSQVRGIERLCLLLAQADMLNALTNVRLPLKSDILSVCINVC